MFVLLCFFFLRIWGWGPLLKDISVVISVSYELRIQDEASLLFGFTHETECLVGKNRIFWTALRTNISHLGTRKIIFKSAGWEGICWFSGGYITGFWLHFDKHHLGSSSSSRYPNHSCSTIPNWAGCCPWTVGRNPIGKQWYRFDGTKWHDPQCWFIFLGIFLFRGFQFHEYIYIYIFKYPRC